MCCMLVFFSLTCSAHPGHVGVVNLRGRSVGCRSFTNNLMLTGVYYIGKALISCCNLFGICKMWGK
jgi:hypothetical protein